MVRFPLKLKLKCLHSKDLHSNEKILIQTKSLHQIETNARYNTNRLTNK